MNATVELTACYRLAPGVAIRPERFGGLVYRYDNRRLYFLHSHQAVEFINCLDGRRSLQEILDENPEVQERGTIAYYLTMIQQEEVDPLPPSERIPVLFAPEPGEAGKPDKK